MFDMVDFVELKQRAGIEQAADMVGIKLTKSRPRLPDQRPICKDTAVGRFFISPT
jgi:hypothetical protein